MNESKGHMALLSLVAARQDKCNSSTSSDHHSDIANTPLTGDFIAAVKLVKDVSFALKDTGGAADDYQDVVRELESLVAVFQEVQSLPAASNNSVLLNAIRRQAQLSQQTITLFLERIQKYNTKIGRNAKHGFHHGTLSKAKWATCVSKEVGKLHGVIQAQSVGVMLLLSMLNMCDCFSLPL
jgi:hypothetical protein